MLLWIGIYLLTWLATLGVTGGYVALCRRLGPRWGFLDIPLHEAHKRHKAPVPVLGGLGMLLGWLTVLGIGTFLTARLPQLFPASVQEILQGVPSVLKRLSAIGVVAVLACGLGMWDDRAPLKALPKFGGQLAVAVAMVAAGFKISFLHAVPGANEAVTVLWILGVMNALNFFDNMDGLAAGACAIAAAVFLFVAAARGQFFVASLAALTGGAATGFYCHNAPPARIFMGDGGSHFLGLLLALCGVLTTFYVPGENPTAAPLLIPLCALGVPLFDAVAVICIRLRLGVPVYIGDNRHISHRFVNIGFTRPQAVLLVHLLCLAVGLAGLTLLWLPPSGAILVLLLLAAVFMMISLIQFKLSPGEAKTK